MSIAYYNGDFCDFDEIRIPLRDRCVFFGDGIYDAAIGRGDKIYLLSEHLDRFFENAARLSLPTPFTRDDLRELLYAVAEKSGYDGYFLYFQLSRLGAEREHTYTDCNKSNLLITVKSHSLPEDNGYSLSVQEDLRHMCCNVKTLNLLPAVMAEKAAKDKNCDEAVLRRGGIITECTHSNVAIVKNGVFYTHPDNRYILPGITKKKILSLCEKLSVPYKCLKFTEDEMLAADEVLVMSTTKLCLHATKIDKVRVGGHNFAVGERLILAIKEDFGRYTD